MKYMGSKARIAKEILPIILKNRKENQWYVEPFVGGANLIDKVTGNRLGADKNEYVISLFKALQTGWIPPNQLSEEEYYTIKQNPSKYSKELVCFAAICCSFAGKWWGGYARGKNNYGQSRNYAKEQATHLLKQSKLLLNIDFKHSSYDLLDIPDNSIIYCDPPYKDTTKYNSEINYEFFYSWCRQQKEKGHTIFISEYNMPEGFICIWQKKINSSLTQDTGSKQGIEKLFTL